MSYKTIMKHLSLMAAFGLLTVGYSIKAGAQDSEASERAIEEVIVTARKKEESLQDIPVVASVLTEEFVQNYKIDDIEAVAELTPGVVIGEAGGNGGFFSIRGVATAAGSQINDMSVTTVVDNLASSKNGLSVFATYDIKQVEVLKGPQPIFFGKNSVAGIINIRSNDPTDETEMFVRTGYESEGEEWYVEGAVSGAISDRLKGRLFARYGEIDGYMKNTAVANPNDAYAPGGGDDFPNGDTTFVRATLLFDPTDTISMRTKLSNYSYDSLDGMGNRQLVECVNGVNSMNNGLFGVRPHVNQDCDADDEAPLHQPAGDFVGVSLLERAESKVEREIFAASHEMAFDIGDFTLSSITGWQEFEQQLDGNIWPGEAAGIGAVNVLIEYEYFSQELRLASNFDGLFNFTVGAYYGDGENLMNFLFGFEPFPIPGNTTPFLLSTNILNGGEPVTYNEDAWSVFVQTEWDLSDQLTLIAGGRYTEEERDFELVVDRMPFDLPMDDTPDKFDDDNFSPELSLTYQLNNDVMLFGTYKEGFKSGGFNIQRPGVTDAGAPIDSETSEGFEVGVKSTLLDGRLRLNVAVYDYEVTDLQVGRYDANTARLQILNAGSADFTGLEVDTTYLPENLNGLTLFASLSYVDAKYGDFFAGCYDGQTAAQGCIVNPETMIAADVGQIFDGKEPQGAPDWQAVAGFTYETYVSDDFILSFNGTVAYTDEYGTNQEQHPLSRHDSFTKINAGVALEPADGQWRLSLQGVNLTDEYTYVQSYSSTGTTAAVTGTTADLTAPVARGRQVWFEFAYNF